MSSILVTCRDKVRAQKSYVAALRLGGWQGEIQLLAPGDEPPFMKEVVGLLLCGGRDIHPRHWDSMAFLHPSADVDEERDALEIPLVRQAWEKTLPILGICRGEQLLNVALGGSLIQDIPSHYECPLDRHSHGTPDQPEIRHSLSIAPDSRLAKLLDSTRIDVNSRHHQAIGRVAPGFRAIAWDLATSLQGQPIIEGIEALSPDHWALGVQWHPENLVQLPNEAGRTARIIFEAFAQASSRMALHTTMTP